MIQKMGRRWSRFWQKRNVENSPLIAFGAVWTRYNETHRAYHGIDHIDFCLTEFDRVRSLAKNPDAIEIAIWFHDVIYDTRRNDNEMCSAKFAIIELLKLDKSPGLGEQVAELIMATKHNFVLTDHDQQLIADIDLSGFAQPWKVVEANSRKIRREYDWVPENEYVASRRKILEWFLDREQGIYYIPEFRTKYENAARENIAHELTRVRELATLPK